MSTSIPDSHKDLLEKAIYVQMATYMKDGSIQVHPVWCSYNGEHIIVNSALGRVKDKNLRANPTVTILAMDPQNPYRWLEVRGTVDEITEKGADEHIEDLSELYLNQRPYPFRMEGEVRVMYKIKALKVTAFAS